MKGNVTDLVKTFGSYSRHEFTLYAYDSIINNFRAFIIDLLLEKLL